jgi:hypothetical protein
MKVQTDIRAGELMDDIARGVEQAAEYVSQAITQADAQASQLTGDVYVTMTSLFNCLNESLQKRSAG